MGAWLSWFLYRGGIILVNVWIMIIASNVVGRDYLDQCTETIRLFVRDLVTSLAAGPFDGALKKHVGYSIYSFKCYSASIVP